jgi:hypothetical protein
MGYAAATRARNAVTNGVASPGHPAVCQAVRAAASHWGAISARHRGYPARKVSTAWPNRARVRVSCASTSGVAAARTRRLPSGNAWLKPSSA